MRQQVLVSGVRKYDRRPVPRSLDNIKGMEVVDQQVLLELV